MRFKENFLVPGYIPNVDGHHPLGGRYPPYNSPRSLHGYLYQQQQPYVPSVYPAGHYDHHEHGYSTQYIQRPLQG